MGQTLVLVSLTRHIGLLEQFLEYYLGLGVDRFLVHINDEEGDGAIAGAARAVMAWYPCTLTHVWSGQYDCYRKVENDAHVLTDFAHEDDWVLVPDLDEFAEYPLPLKTLLDYCTRTGCNAIRGRFTDRIAEGGELPVQDPALCVFAQFPYRAEITGPVLQGQTPVLCAVRGSVPVNRHFTGDDAPVLGGAPLCFLPSLEVPVHHFKWSQNAIERMVARYLLYKERHAQGQDAFDFYEEGKRFLDYLAANDGRFDLADPLLGASWDGRCLFKQHPESVTCSCGGGKEEQAARAPAPHQARDGSPSVAP